ncbi:ubiquitin-conjugating enzyme/RWD-like protein [Polychytrium aggregatum]|uniref:ubiquitin-conjugating enzyme/RWD-like protein n=1 Tax=Polychytrium aggregatum TaxID=110093 RepID=UPI0022FF2CFD|nr:ubiquitin-conjugating enzyme/RWD-like protein [Polychytrium aggregatum]KAI9193738.1 ubiquitin-conjugating enzyme/RWD-like protein [Polychytrium aggregatum]
MSNRALLRIQKELGDISRNPDHQIELWYSDSNIKHIHAIVTGPPGTPYSFGLFDFRIDCGDNYPTQAPEVLCQTTDFGKVRFNPNIYASGKICLSILGTWRGEANEMWSSAHGILSVLISIQSLMCDKPYLNEPGYQNTNDQQVIQAYNSKIIHETLRVSICNRLEASEKPHPEPEGSDTKTEKPTGIIRHYCHCRQSDPFADLCKHMLLLHYDTYMSIVERESAKIADGTAFPIMQFEGGGNAMSGVYNYTSIKERLKKIYHVTLNESHTWFRELSPQWIKDELTTASNLRAQFEQIQASNELDIMTVELEDDNPFKWTLIVLGMPASCYDGGVFKIDVWFHHQFPEVRPRVRFATEIFHPHVTSDGVPYYRVQRAESVKHHLLAIQDLLLKDPASAPETHVNHKAAKLYFGTKDERKDFNRNARRCAQKSVE